MSRQLHLGRKISFLIVVTLLSSNAAAQSIFTLAGGGNGDGRPATLTPFAAFNLLITSDGDIYVVEQSGRVRRIDARTGIMNAFAGVGGGEFGGDDAPATLATLSSPNDVAADAEGNIYISDSANARIRRVDAKTRFITTIAGEGTDGYNGDDIPATRAALLFPKGLAFDSRGNLIIADHGNHRIRRIDAATQTITTVAGTGIPGSSSDGIPASQAPLNQPEDVVVDPSGNIFLAESGGHRIRRIDAVSGLISTVAGNGSAGYAGDLGQARDAILNYPTSLALNDRLLYVSDTFNERVRLIDLSTGVITSVVGRDINLGPDSAPPLGIALDDRGNLHYAGNILTGIYRVDRATSAIQRIAGNGVQQYSGDGGPADQGSLGSPYAVAVDVEGHLLIGDLIAGSIRRVDREGLISTVARSSGSLLLRPLGITIIDDRTALVASTRIYRVDLRSFEFTPIAGQDGEPGDSGDGGPATLARFRDPHGVAIDRVGNIYIADTHNARVRRIDAQTQIIATIAGNGVSGDGGDGELATTASLNFPTDIAIDARGNVLIADSFNRRIRRVDTSTKIITTIAGTGEFGTDGDGGPATLATFRNPARLRILPSGEIYVADVAVRRIDTNGTITTIAGTGQQGLSGDGGPATRATLNFPRGLDVGVDGTLYIADTQNDRVRVVYPCRGFESPRQLFPTSGSLEGSSSVALKWASAAGAFFYDVRLDAVNPPRTVVASGAKGTSFPATNLIPGRTYYWQVVARGDPYCSPIRERNSDVRSFTITKGCERPEVAAP